MVDLRNIVSDAISGYMLFSASPKIFSFPSRCVRVISASTANVFVAAKRVRMWAAALKRCSATDAIGSSFSDDMILSNPK